MTSLYALIVGGGSPPPDLTDEERDYWHGCTDRVAEAKRKEYTPEIPFEMPDIISPSTIPPGNRPW